MQFYLNKKKIFQQQQKAIVESTCWRLNVTIEIVVVVFSPLISLFSASMCNTILTHFRVLSYRSLCLVFAICVHCLHYTTTYNHLKRVCACVCARVRTHTISTKHIYVILFSTNYMHFVFALDQTLYVLILWHNK